MSANTRIVDRSPRPYFTAVFEAQFWGRMVTKLEDVKSVVVLPPGESTISGAAKSSAKEKLVAMRTLVGDRENSEKTLEQMGERGHLLRMFQAVLSLGFRKGQPEILHKFFPPEVGVPDVFLLLAMGMGKSKLLLPLMGILHLAHQWRDKEGAKEEAASVGSRAVVPLSTSSYTSRIVRVSRARVCHVCWVLGVSCRVSCVSCVCVLWVKCVLCFSHPLGTTRKRGQSNNTTVRGEKGRRTINSPDKTLATPDRWLRLLLCLLRLLLRQQQ